MYDFYTLYSMLLQVTWIWTCIQAVVLDIWKNTQLIVLMAIFPGKSELPLLII